MYSEGAQPSGLMDLAAACEAMDQSVGLKNSQTEQQTSNEEQELGLYVATEHVSLPVPSSEIVSGASTYKKRKRGGRSGPDFRIAPGDDSAINKAIKRSQTRKHEQTFYPEEGLTFNSCEEAREFYNLYSWEVGFGTRSGKSRRNAEDYLSWAEFFCSCEGFEKNPMAASTRTGCKARISLHRTEEDGWFISTFFAEHNHPLSEGYHEKKQWKSHGHIDPITKGFIRNLRENNVPLGKVSSILNCDTSFNSLPVFRKGAVKSICASISQDRLKDDIGKTIKLLEEMKQADPSLSVSLDVDSEGTIRNIMWCTGKNMMDYGDFGDVVTFDTTYRTNLYKMPFGLFVGANNHFQTVVFAGVLMTSETTQAFEWVFATFSSIMGNKRPVTILTDQASAMEAALKTTWPHTNHRWCRWHVLKDAKSKIGVAYSKESGFKAKFNVLVSKVMTPNEFEEEWASLIKKYKLVSNKFLQRIFKKRDKWAKPYFLDIFCAGMTSTQRSESANHMIKKQIPREAPMHLFVAKYNSFLQNRDGDEGIQRHQTKQKSRVFRVNAPIERHAKEIYSNRMFQKFGDELYESGTFAVQRKEDMHSFIVVDVIKAGQEFTVTLNQGQTMIDCSCGMIIHAGMLCRHSLKVLVHLNRKEIPPQNILRRWTASAGSSFGTIDTFVSRDGTSNENKALMHNTLWLAAMHLVENGKENMDAFSVAINILENGASEIEKLASLSEGKNKDTSQNNNQVVSPSFVDLYVGYKKMENVAANLKCPPRKIHSGRPNSSSLKSWQNGRKQTNAAISRCRMKKLVADVDEDAPNMRTKRLGEFI